MFRPLRTARAAWLAAAAGFGILYLFGLGDAGLLGPDEPRYASIGRAMADSGDWITPRLWGAPWFEKPALLYWMIALGRLAGLGPEWGPRLPVTLLSLAFLVFYYRTLRREFGPPAARYAAIMLASCLGWFAFSEVAVTDLPMSALFSAAMFMALRWIDTGSRRAVAASGALLGAAVLAKGFVPLVLLLPAAWFARRHLAAAWPGAAAFLAVAAPWYLACWARNGQAFVNDFILRHHFERFTTNTLLHQQPFWFYVPVLAAGLLPWTPLAALTAWRQTLNDWKRQFLIAWLACGFLFFSAATNKLPGYLLPLVPAACALLGIAAAEAPRARWTLAAAALVPGLFPAIAAILPEVLAGGLRRASWAAASWYWMAPAALAAAIVWWLDRKGKRDAALLAVTLITCAALFWAKTSALEPIERRVSARPLWRAVAPRANETCVGEMHRAWRYGLNYYSLTPLPDCQTTPRPLQIHQPKMGQPELRNFSALPGENRAVQADPFFGSRIPAERSPSP